MKILLIDDHGLFRAGLCRLLQDLEPNISVEEARSVASAEQFSPRVFDLILLDLTMPDTSGVNTLERIKLLFPDSTVVVVSGEEDPRVIHSVIESGASGYIPKSSEPNILLLALRLVLEGGIYLPRQAMAAFEKVIVTKDPKQQELERLTGRQRQIFAMAVKGISNKQIARDLDLSVNTVKSHLSTVYREMGFHNRTEAVYWCGWDAQRLERILAAASHD
jgi:DNA-binding NarL/FixJ family response regulator